MECSRFPEYQVSRIAVHSNSAQILFCVLQLRSTVQWIQPIQAVFLLRKQHSIQQYNGLHNWFDRNQSSNGLDQRCQDLLSLPELADKSGIDLQFSSIQSHCSPEVKLPVTMDGWPRHPPHQEAGECWKAICQTCWSYRWSWSLQWLKIGNLLESTLREAEAQREQTTVSDRALDSEQARVEVTQWMTDLCTQPCRAMWLPCRSQG